MQARLERLIQRHRRLDRLIDTTRSAGRQEQVKALKRLRLHLKDRIAELRRRALPVTR